MNRFYLLRIVPAPVKLPNFSCWVGKKVDCFDELLSDDAMSYKCDSTLLRIRLYKDLLQKQYNLSDTSYEILIRSHGRDLVINDEAGWALAVLMFG